MLYLLKSTKLFPQKLPTIKFSVSRHAEQQRAAGSVNTVVSAGVEPKRKSSPWQAQVGWGCTRPASGLV